MDIHILHYPTSCLEQRMISIRRKYLWIKKSGFWKSSLPKVLIIASLWITERSFASAWIDAHRITVQSVLIYTSLKSYLIWLVQSITETEWITSGMDYEIPFRHSYGDIISTRKYHPRHLHWNMLKQSKFPIWLGLERPHINTEMIITIPACRLEGAGLRLHRGLGWRHRSLSSCKGEQTAYFPRIVKCDRRRPSSVHRIRVCVDG